MTRRFQLNRFFYRNSWRPCTTDEIAAVAVMLVCNGYITGQTINVDGGRCLG